MKIFLRHAINESSSKQISYDNAIRENKYMKQAQHLDDVECDEELLDK